MSVSTRVALVTGASGGIGRAVAQRLAADGMSVGVHYVTNKSEAEGVVAGIEESGGRAIAVAGDVADEVAMAGAFDALEKAFGGVDVVAHIAGVGMHGPLAELDLNAFDELQRTNVRGTFVVSQLGATRLRAGGAIVNLSTTLTKLAPAGNAAYAASKGAVEAMTLILARELKGRDVTVNAVAPGPTATPAFLAGKPQPVLDHLAGQAPLERLGTPEDIAEAVAFLAGPGRWVNGQVVFANGGMV
ncbi:SDR family oxidoreductase [Streptomyces sp. NPDC089919]|uniref:SDR family oxidoreductase n=1 Tax=Streptomyces sp. NPDC089919 TaxID=3155188 RepID=UPI003440776E